MQDRVCAELEDRPARNCKEVDPAGGDIFAEVARSNGKATAGQFVQKLRLEQMHLTKVRLAWIGPHAVAMFDSDAKMGVAFNAQALQHS